MKRVYNLKIEHKNVPKKSYSVVGTLPPKVDLRQVKNIPVYDQGHLGSCTANALVGLVQYQDPTFYGSRLFLYEEERKLDGDVPDDNGSTISQGMNVLTQTGVCSEQLWPYNISVFTDTPTAACYVDAAHHRVAKYHHVEQTEQSMKACLAMKNPIALGIQVYQSFETEDVAKSGMVPMPVNGEKLLGGHAVDVWGYDDSKQCWIMRNSWGSTWGDNGYFYLPYAYLLNQDLCGDIVTVTELAVGNQTESIWSLSSLGKWLGSWF